jgi:hypothetical protein
MTPQEYNDTRYQRWADSWAHDREMSAKYLAMGKNPDDISSWWEKREEVKEGKTNSYYHHDYPKPYSDLYLRRFLNLIVRHNFTDIKPSLYREFVGDKVDRDYIEALLVDAEDLGLSTDEAVVIVDESGETCYPPPSPFEFYNFMEVPTSNIFYGGNSFQRRASLVREWCQEMALAEAQAKPGLPIVSKQLADNSKRIPLDAETQAILPDFDAPYEVDDVLYEYTESDTLPFLPRRSKLSKRTPLPELRKPEVRLDKYLIDLTTSDCDFIGKAVGFWPPELCPNGTFILANKHVSYAPARLMAIADVLAASFIIAKKKEEFTLQLAERFGWPRLSERIDRKESKAYDSAKKDAQAALDDLLKKKVATETNGIKRNQSPFN